MIFVTNVFNAAQPGIGRVQVLGSKKVQISGMILLAFNSLQTWKWLGPGDPKPGAPSLEAQAQVYVSQGLSLKL